MSDIVFCCYQAVFTCNQTLGIDLKPQQEVTLRLYRQFLNPNNEPVLDNEKIWKEVSDLATPQDM